MILAHIHCSATINVSRLRDRVYQRWSSSGNQEHNAPMLAGSISWIRNTYICLFRQSLLANCLYRILSVVPFVAFLVVTGNVIVTTSSADLSLLRSTTDALASAAEKSPIAHRLHGVCSKFYQIATIIHDQQKKSGAIQNHMLQQATATEGTAYSMQVDPLAMYGNNYPMLQQHWDGIMEDSHLEFGDINAGELATFVEPYLMPGQFLGPFN